MSLLYQQKLEEREANRIKEEDLSTADEAEQSPPSPDPSPVDGDVSNGSSGASVELVSVSVRSDDVQCESMPAAKEVVNGDLNGSEEDCVIVAQTRTSITPNKTVEQGHCSIRGNFFLICLII